MTEIMQKHSVQKLRGLLNDRYGMGLEITSMVSIADLDVAQARSEVRGSSLYVPVCARGKYLATAILSRADALSTGDISAVSDIVRLVLEPALFSVYLERQETNTQNFNSENVIPLTANRDWNFKNQMENQFITNESLNEDFNQSQNSGWGSGPIEFHSSMILLEGFNPHTISRVAVHIHEVANRWALLRYSEIRSGFLTVKDLCEMGPLTLFVEDILQLDRQEQTLLTEFAKVSDSKAEPLILVGCTSSLTDLIQRELVISPLADIVYNSRLELDRMPQEFAKLRETIELALDKHALISH